MNGAQMGVLLGTHGGFMAENKCPECGQPMFLVRVLGDMEDLPPLGAFYCRPCGMADTVSLTLDDTPPAAA